MSQAEPFFPTKLDASDRLPPPSAWTLQILHPLSRCLGRVSIKGNRAAGDHPRARGRKVHRMAHRVASAANFVGERNDTDPASRPEPQRQSQINSHSKWLQESPRNLSSARLRRPCLPGFPPSPASPYSPPTAAQQPFAPTATPPHLPSVLVESLPAPLLSLC